MTTPAILYAAKSTEDYQRPDGTGRPPRAGRARRLDCGRDLRRLTLARRFAGRRPDEAERGERGIRRRPCVPCPGLHRQGGGAMGRHRRRLAPAEPRRIQP